MSGSATTVRWLLREGFLDELHLLVHPITVGAGMARLFPPEHPQTPLELLSSQTFETGVLHLAYAPAGLHADLVMLGRLAQAVSRARTVPLAA